MYLKIDFLSKSTNFMSFCFFNSLRKTEYAY